MWFLFQAAVMIGVGFPLIYFEQNIAHQHFGMAVPFLSIVAAYLATRLVNFILSSNSRFLGGQ
jgi:hypothetical protein